METLKLTVFRNGKEEVIEKECCDIPFETTGKLIDCLDIDFTKINGSTINQLQLLKKVGSVINEIRPIVLFVFPEITEEEIKKCSTKEIVKVAVKAILFTFRDCYSELKNELMAGLETM